MDILTHLLSGAVSGLVYNPEVASWVREKVHKKKTRREPFTSDSTEQGHHNNSTPLDTSEMRGPTTPSANLSSLKTMETTRRAVRWSLLIGSVLPDIDILFLLGGWSLYRTYHRGPTHSVLGVMILALLLSWIVGKRYPMITKSRLFIASLIGMTMHLALDLLTSYRTYLLWPFSDQRFAFGILRFHDRTGWWVLGSALLVGCIVGEWGNFDKERRNLKSPTLIGALGFLAYTGYILMQAG